MTSAAGSSVNPTLSRGLADRAIDALEHQAHRYVDLVIPILARRSRNKKGLNQATTALQQLGERLRLVQTIGRSPNGRHVTVCQFVTDAVIELVNGTREVTFLLRQRNVPVSPR